MIKKRTFILLSVVTLLAAGLASAEPGLFGIFQLTPEPISGGSLPSCSEGDSLVYQGGSWTCGSSGSSSTGTTCNPSAISLQRIENGNNIGATTYVHYGMFKLCDRDNWNNGDYSCSDGIANVGDQIDGDQYQAKCDNDFCVISSHEYVGQLIPDTHIIGPTSTTYVMKGEFELSGRESGYSRDGETVSACDSYDGSKYTAQCKSAPGCIISFNAPSQSSSTSNSANRLNINFDGSQNFWVRGNQQEDSNMDKAMLIHKEGFSDFETSFYGDLAAKGGNSIIRLYSNDGITNTGIEIVDGNENGGGFNSYIDFRPSSSGDYEGRIIYTDNAANNVKGLSLYGGNNGNGFHPDIFINGEGNVGIGNGEPSSKLHVAGTITEDSDIRLKENLRDIEDPIDKIKRLNGVTFNWQNKEKYNDKKQIGLVAQEVEKVFPEAVITDSKGYKSVSYSRMVTPLIEAIKKQQEMIEKQERENQKLRERLAAIEKKLQ